MRRSSLSAGVRHLRLHLAAQQRQEESDEQLLFAFTRHQDESAFAALVSRYGPMVLNVCRRVLGHEQDAEDAFQAVFLVLARRAAALRDKTALASFLHGTAYRLALSAKRAAVRRRKHEGLLGALTQPRSPADESSWREVRTLLDEEISHLPEKYRTPFVLCCLENISQAEAASRLGLKQGTLSSRLTTARKRLARRLARRGVELTAVLSACAAQTASALPAVLLAKTVDAVTKGIVSASVAVLAKGAMAALGSKAKIATVVLLMSALTVATSGSLVALTDRTCRRRGRKLSWLAQRRDTDSEWPRGSPANRRTTPPWSCGWPRTMRP
jgi:RNA polymerase sigma factor (sigma-70 family)